MTPDDITLKEYFESRLDALEKATHMAADNLERRLEGMNERDSMLKTQTGVSVTKVEFDAILLGINKDIRELRDFKNTHEGKASQGSVIISIIIGVLGVLIAAVALFK